MSPKELGWRTHPHHPEISSFRPDEVDRLSTSNVQKKNL